MEGNIWFFGGHYRFKTFVYDVMCIKGMMTNHKMYLMIGYIIIIIM